MMDKKEKAEKLIERLCNEFYKLGNYRTQRLYEEGEKIFEFYRQQLLALIPGEVEIKKPKNKNGWWRGCYGTEMSLETNLEDFNWKHALGFCSCCGKYPPLSDKYCGGCGSKLKWKDGE